MQLKSSAALTNPLLQAHLLATAGEVEPATIELPFGQAVAARVKAKHLSPFKFTT